MIIDTSFALDVINDVEAAVSKERELEVEGVTLVIPSMTVLELYIGVGKVSTTQEERKKVQAVLDSYPLVDIHPASPAEPGGCSGSEWPRPRRGKVRDWKGGRGDSGDCHRSRRTRSCW